MSEATDEATSETPSPLNQLAEIHNRRILEVLRRAMFFGEPAPSPLDMYCDALEELAERTVVERWAEGVADSTTDDNQGGT